MTSAGFVKRKCTPHNATRPAGYPAGRDYLIFPPVVIVGENRHEHRVSRSFCRSREPESNRHRRSDELSMLPLHHRGTNEKVCSNYAMRKEVGTVLADCPHLVTPAV